MRSLIMPDFDTPTPLTPETGSARFSLAGSDLYSLLVSAFISAGGTLLAVLSGLTPDHFSDLGPFAALATSLCLVTIAALREWLAAGDLLSYPSWVKLGRSLSLALGGAVIAWVQTLFTGGLPSASAIAIWTFLLNLSRKFVFDTRSK
jgi:hypothetical protein